MAGKARQRAKHAAHHAAHHTTANAHHTHQHVDHAANNNVAETEEQESASKVYLIEDRHPLQERHNWQWPNICNSVNHVHVNNDTEGNVDVHVHKAKINCINTHSPKQEEEEEEEEQQQVHKQTRDGHLFSVRKEKPIFREPAFTTAATSEERPSTQFTCNETEGREQKWLKLYEENHYEDDEQQYVEDSDGVTGVCANERHLHKVLKDICNNIYEKLSQFNGKTDSLNAFNLSQPLAPEESKFRSTLPYDVDVFCVNAIGTAQILLENALASLPAEWNELVQATIKQEWTIWEVREQFANMLEKTLTKLLKCQTFGTTRKLSPLTSYAPVITAISKRAMRDWLDRHILPAALRETYCNDISRFIHSYDDLLQIVHTDAVMWLTTFVPMLESLSSSDNTSSINILWMNLNQLNINAAIRLFHILHFDAKLQTLIINKANECRGVLVPKDWLRQFVAWARSCQENISFIRNTANNDNNNDNIIDINNTSAAIPGPINTFSLVEIMPSYPLKHFIRHNDTEHVDVVPERFYDDLVRLFGSGPKYRAFGNFTMKEEVLQSLAAAHMNVEIAFCWHTVEENAPTQKRVTVYVEDALVCTDLWEVLRVGLELVREEDNLMEKRDMERWSASVVALNNIKCEVKECNEVMLKEPITLLREGIKENMSLRDLITEALAKEVKRRSCTLAKHTDCVSEEDTNAAHVDNECDDIYELSHTRQLSMAINVIMDDDDEDKNESKNKNKEIISHDTSHDNADITQIKSSNNGMNGGVVEVKSYGVCGLTNIGNTCYMNSALQCLSNLSQFRSLLFTLPISHYPNASITTEMLYALMKVWSGSCKYAETNYLKNAIARKANQFANYEQQDANEFIEVLLDKMHEELNIISGTCYRERTDEDKHLSLQQLSDVFWDNYLENNQSFLPKLFFHQSKTTFTCLTCGSVSTVFDNNVTVSVNIKETCKREWFKVIMFCSIENETLQVNTTESLQSVMCKDNVHASDTTNDIAVNTIQNTSSTINNNLDTNFFTLIVRTSLFVHAENKSLRETQLRELFLTTVEKRPDVLSRFQQARNTCKNETTSREECDIYTMNDIEEHFEAKFTPMLSWEDTVLLDVRFTLKSTLATANLTDEIDTTTISGNVITHETKANSTFLFHGKSEEELKEKSHIHQHLESRQSREEQEEEQYKQHKATCNSSAIENEENSYQRSFKESSKVNSNNSNKEQSILILYFVSPERELTDTTLRNCVYSERLVISDFPHEFYLICKNEWEQEEQSKKEFEEEWNKLKKNKQSSRTKAEESEEQKGEEQIDQIDESNDDSEAILTSALEEAVNSEYCHLKHNKFANDITGSNNNNTKDQCSDENGNVKNTTANEINNNISTDSLECRSEKYVDCTEKDSEQSDSVSMQPKLPSMENTILTRHIYTQATNIARKVLKYGNYVAKSANNNTTDEEGANSNSNNNKTHQDDKDVNDCTFTKTNVIKTNVDINKKYGDDQEAALEDLYMNEEEPAVAANVKEKTEVECNNDTTSALTQSDENNKAVLDYSNTAAKLDDFKVKKHIFNFDKDNQLEDFHEGEDVSDIRIDFENIKTNGNNETCSNAEKRKGARARLKHTLLQDFFEQEELIMKEEANMHANEEFVEEYAEEKDRSAREAAIDAEVSISRFEFVHDKVEPLICNPIYSNMSMYHDILMQREIINSTMETNCTKGTNNHERNFKRYDGIAGGSNDSNKDATMCNHNDHKEQEENEQEEQHKHQQEKNKESSENNKKNAGEEEEEQDDDIALNLLEEITYDPSFFENKYKLQAKWKDWRLTSLYECNSKSHTESTCTTTTKPIPVISIIISYNKKRVFFDKSTHLLIHDEADESETLNLKVDSWRSSKHRSSDSRLSDEESNLHECLVNAAVPDRLTGDNAWYCEHCQVRRDALTQRKIFRLPPILLISFKRFKHTVRRNDKNNTLVHFPTSLDMRPYLDPAADHSLEHTQYRLKGVVYHSGSLNFGHYTAIAFNDSIRKWVSYNDENANVWDADEPRSENAYILCYERVQPNAIKTDSSPER